MKPFYAKYHTDTTLVVEKRKQTQYYGIRIDVNGQKSRWVCPQEIFPDEEELPRTYLQINDQYYKLSPFITLKRIGIDFQEYVFSSLIDSLTGQIKLCPLFGNIPEMHDIYSDFARFSECDEYREVSLNGTVMNYFECNYQDHYQDVGFSKVVLEFLQKNKSTVSATLWGHGGVGKTACIQYVCQQLFCGKEKIFSYIVFITAKDRIYNPLTGKIIKNNAHHVRQYSEVIEAIIQTVYPDLNLQFGDDDLSRAETLIKEYTGKLLIVIDDYETFLDEEKQKISKFIMSLDINYHKVIITTRNLRLSIGTPIPTAELDIGATSTFLQNIISSKCPELSGPLERELTQNTVAEKIWTATYGRPIFIYQFAYIYMQVGMRENIFSALHSGAEARDFLYGRVYDYLTDTTKMVFSAIPPIINDDLLFRFDMLRYILQKEITDDDKFEAAVDELVNQLVIERYNDTQGRVYAQELLAIMQSRFANLSESRREAIRRLIESIGGKEISGTIEEAMLQEADQSRRTGNVVDIIGKYRRVLNLKECPTKIRKQALINAASYLTIHDLNPKAASELFAEFFPHFKDDAQIAYQYVVCLWQQEERKFDAVNFIWDFFSKANGHKKASMRYLQLFALGTSYCTYYDTTLRSYDTIAKRRNQLSQTINEFGRELFVAVKDNFESLRPGVKHVVQMGLTQTIKACVGFESDDIAKINLAIEICEFSLGRFTSRFALQTKQMHEKLTRKIKLLESQKGVSSSTGNTTPFWWPTFVTDNYHIDDCVEGIVSGIVPYGIFIKFGKNRDCKGLLHISKISQGFMPSNHLPDLFFLGQPISVKIINIDVERKRVDFALKELI